MEAVPSTTKVIKNKTKPKIMVRLLPINSSNKLAINAAGIAPIGGALAEMTPIIHEMYYSNTSICVIHGSR